MKRLTAIIRAMSRRERLILLGAVVIFVAAALSKTIIFVQANSYLVGDTGGELREGMVSQPAFINPVVPVTEADRDISRLVFSNLIDISDSVKVSADNRVYDIRLKNNVFWSDNTKLTADDVIFTIETIQDPESRSPLYRSFQGVQADRVSEVEIELSLPTPYAFFESDQLQNLEIIPKHIFYGVQVQNLQYSLYGLQPVGSGPYIAKGYASDDRGDITSLTLQSNKNYFGDKPKIDTITFKFYADTDELMKAYESGAIDAMGLSIYDAAVSKLPVRNDQHYLLSYRYYAIFINPNTAPKQLQDIKVREALSGLVDRANLVNTVLGGHGKVLYGPTDFSANPALRLGSGQAPNYDPTVLQGVSLDLTVPDEPFLRQTADIVKQEWESAGAQVNLIVKSPKDIQEETLKNSDYSMLLFGNITQPSQDLFAFWHSSQRFYPDQNLAFYQNKKVDTELETYRKTIDPKARSVLLGQVSNAISADIPAIFLYSPDYLYVTTPVLGGLGNNKTISTAADRFSDVTSWYMVTKRVFR